uniref:Uncharacterized protein n=1 Tax=Oryza punctata TaxID=4537 RepID=A0A0E0M7Q5_ORYPU
MRAAASDPSPAPARSMLKRLFDRQLLRVSPAERIPAAAAVGGEKDEVEPSSVCLDGMVRSFLEDGSGGGGVVGAVAERAGHGARRCNCFHGGGSSDDDDDEDDAAASSDVAETIKGLVHCATLRERNLLADVCGHVERHRAAGARRRELLGLVAASLRAAGHDAAVCVSRWDKSTSHPAGEHAYVDVLLPPLPSVFVGKEDRLRLLVAASADAARASLKKRGLHLPPWRKPEYMRAKWLSPYDREPAPPDEASAATAAAAAAEIAGDESPAAA